VAYRVKKYVGSYIAVLGGVDAIVFTGGIGEHAAHVRAMIMENMEYCGAKFDLKKNAEYKDGIGEISADDSKVKILVVPTNEELSIARETKALTCK
ncbi:MAG: acetate kinase, partial [Clostridia bacterium]|nr:acetate kinase [Clostridia bacterium]